MADQRTSSVEFEFNICTTDPRKATMRIAGEHLSKAQLSDLIQAWVDVHRHDPFAHELAGAVSRHGRFE